MVLGQRPVGFSDPCADRSHCWASVRLGTGGRVRSQGRALISIYAGSASLATEGLNALRPPKDLTTTV